MEGPGHGVLLTNTKRLPQRDASANYSDKDLVMPGNVIHNELRKQLDFFSTQNGPNDGSLYSGQHAEGNLSTRPLDFRSNSCTMHAWTLPLGLMHCGMSN